MAQETQLNVGRLKSDISITIETREAARLFLGRRSIKEEDKLITARIVGVSAALTLLNRINFFASRLEDPYAEFHFIEIERKIAEHSVKLQALLTPIESKILLKRKLINFSDSYSVSPLEIPIVTSSSMGFMLLYYYKELDQTIKTILLAKHIGIIKASSAKSMVYQALRGMRALTLFISHFEPSQVTRKDFNDDGTPNSELAAMKIARFKPLPLEILNGTLRSDYISEVVTHEKD